jgi:fumarate reductase subunit D
MPTEKISTLFITPAFANGVAAIAIISTLMLFVIQFCFAIGVFQAALKLYDERRLLFVGPFVWFFATLLVGVFVVPAFWIMHYSTMNEQIASRIQEQSIHLAAVKQASNKMSNKLDNGTDDEVQDYLK